MSKEPSVLERAARALCKVNGVDPDKLDQVGEPLWIAWKQSARAVLQAIREPTEAMIEAGRFEVDAEAFAMQEAWSTMIDTALTE